MAQFLPVLLRLSLLGSVLAGALLLVRLALWEHVSRRVYYYLWVFVLLRLCVPLGVTFPVPVLEVENPFAVLRSSGAGAPPSAPEVPTVPAAPGISEDVGPDAAEPGAQTLPAAPDTPSAPEAPEASAQDPLRVLASPAPWLALWAAGALVCLGWYVRGYQRFAGALLQTAREPSEEARNILGELDPRGRVRLVESPAANGPLLMGLARPTIVLPPGVDGDRLRDILAHELTHARRWDLLVKWWAAGVGCLHWFNPAVYLIRREIARACELACDEAVVKEMSPEGRRHYGETLLTLAAAPPAGLLAVTLCEEKKRLKERLVSLVWHRKRGPAAAALAVVLALAVGSCALIGDAELTPVPEGKGWKALVESFNPNQNTRQILYEIAGFGIIFPDEIDNQLLIFPGDVDEDGNGMTVLSVYEKQSYEESMADQGIGAGFLFSIQRLDRAQYELYLTGDRSGQECFTKDTAYYYIWNTATDVQFYRSGITDYSQADFTPWNTLTECFAGIRSSFIGYNGLEKYSDETFLNRDFTYKGEHCRVLFAVDSYGISQLLTLSQPVKQGEGGIWCVERYVDERHGGTYYTFSMEGTPQSEGIPAMEHYQALQAAADRGERPDLLDPLEAAKVWLKNEYYDIRDDTLDAGTVLLKGEPAGAVWPDRMEPVFQQVCTLETLTLDGQGNESEVQSFGTLPPLEDLRFEAVRAELSGILWEKADPEDTSGNAVRCVAEDQSQIVFLDRDGLIGIQRKGYSLWRWFRPAQKVSPYQIMLTLCQEGGIQGAVVRAEPTPAPDYEMHLLE